jgi:hypothetical protein
METKTIKIAIALGICSLAGCAEIDRPYYDRYPYRSAYWDDYNYDRYYYDRDLRREREALERSRAAYDRERRYHRGRYGYPGVFGAPPVSRSQNCPPGFRPSENKCSPSERRRGCKDIRLSSGLGCVSR